MKWYPLPPMKMWSGGRGGSFFRASGGCDFSYEPLPLGGGAPVPISCPVHKHRTQVCRSEFNKLPKRGL